MHRDKKDYLVANCIIITNPTSSRRKSKSEKNLQESYLSIQLLFSDFSTESHVSESPTDDTLNLA